MVVEIKPKRQVERPNQNPKRRTQAWQNSVKTWMINQANGKQQKSFVLTVIMNSRL